MIGKNTIKWVHSLEMKKNRKREQLFVAEGPKVVGDLLAHYRPRAVFATSEWEGRSSVPSYAEVETVSDDELRRLSFLQHPQQVLAVFEMGEQGTPSLNADRLTLVLDGVQDPGNLGTIIRIADWFGIDNIICSPETADAYNPKVVQATMGSLAHVHLHYIDLNTFIAQQSGNVPIFGTFLNGKDIYSTQLSQSGIIVMGNEGNGISDSVSELVSHRLLIPDFHEGKSAESLNVAIATAIVCSEFRRRE